MSQPTSRDLHVNSWVDVLIATKERRAESGSKTRVQKVIEDRIDAAVGAAQPLDDGYDDVPEFTLFIVQFGRTQLEDAESQVKRQPGQSEGSDDGQQHPQGPHFGAVKLRHGRRMLILQLRRRRRLARNATIPHSPPDEGVAHDLPSHKVKMFESTQQRRGDGFRTLRISY